MYKLAAITTTEVQNLNADFALQDRLAYGQVYGVSPERKGLTSHVAAAQPPRSFLEPTGGAARRRRGARRGAPDGDRDAREEPDEEEAYAGNRYR
jgi:hypothetical protein